MANTLAGEKERTGAGADTFPIRRRRRRRRALLPNDVGGGDIGFSQLVGNRLLEAS